MTSSSEVAKTDFSIVFLHSGSEINGRFELAAGERLFCKTAVDRSSHDLQVIEIPLTPAGVDGLRHSRRKAAIGPTPDTSATSIANAAKFASERLGNNCNQSSGISYKKLIHINFLEAAAIERRQLAESVARIGNLSDIEPAVLPHCGDI